MNIAKKIPMDSKLEIKEPVESTSFLKEKDVNNENKRPALVSRNSVVIGRRLGRLSWFNYILLTVASAIPSAIYIILYTEMGYGLTVFFYLSNHFQKYANYVLIGAISLFVILYLLDFSYWKGPTGVFARTFSWCTIVFLLFLWVLLMTGEIPYGPISLSAILIPVWLLILCVTLFKKYEKRVVISWLSAPLFLVSIITCLSWITWTWIKDENEWNALNQAIGAEKVGCEADFTDHPQCAVGENLNEVCFTVIGETVIFPENNSDCIKECVEVYKQCLNTFIMWVGPLLMAAVMLFLSFICSFLRSGSTEQELSNFGKLWLLLLGSMWISASMVGGGEGVASALASFTLASFIGSIIFLSVCFTKDDETKIASVVTNISDKYGSFIDIAKGLIVLFAGPIAVVALLISSINQAVRKIGLPCSKKFKSESEKNDWITKKMRHRVDDFQTWELTKVLTYALYWGLGLIVVNVLVGKFVTLFLSWLVDYTREMNVALVTITLFGVGIIMFLLPPVPGIPIYLTLGIVIVPTGSEIFGLAGAIIYACVVSLSLKLFATAMQQKAIGEVLSNSVSIRRAVGINSHLIRTTKLILMDPKLSMAKVSILVGGPDWPISVLCGILRLNLCQILIGTLPVALLIFPTVLSGSFTYMSGDSLKYPWASTASTICTAFTGGVILYFMSLAAYHVENVATQRADELKEIPFDKEVLEMEEEQMRKYEEYSRATQWVTLPLFSKILLSLSVFHITASLYIVQIFMDKCFAKFSLTSSIETDLDGNALNFILPLGWVVMGLVLISIILFRIFSYITTKFVNANSSKIIDTFSLEAQPVLQKSDGG